jgi:DHA2 family multidrug resistance protein
VIFGIFMVILDTTVVNVAFQTIRNEFGGSLNDTQWVISIYVLLLGISTPLAGYLAKRFGARRIYLGGLGLFAFGSLMCGLAPTLALLIAARALQGIGGGLVMPLGMALLLQAFPVREHGTALGYFGIAGLVAPAVGPILGGWLADLHLWRVIFFINPPIGLIGVILGLRFLRDGQTRHKPRLDGWGILTEAVGFGAILYAASIASTLGWTAPPTLAWFAVGLAGLAAFAWVELKVAPEPLLDLRLFTNRIFLNATLLGYVSTVALFGAEFLMPIYLQALRGYSALQTGLILLPMAVAGGIFVTLSGRIFDRIGPRPLMVAGFSLLVINTWQLMQIEANTTIAWITFLLVLRGFALGMTVQTTMVTSLMVVPQKELARGSSLTNATRLVVQSIGVALLATILASTLSPEVKALQSSFREGGSAAHSGRPAGVCSTAGPGFSGTSALVASADSSPIPAVSAAPIPPAETILERACRENIAGFELAYRTTFLFSLLALLLGVLLPGWPGKWKGRTQHLPVAHT